LINSAIRCANFVVFSISGWIDDWRRCVAPWIKDQLRVTVVSNHPAKKLASDQVANSPRLRLGKGAWPDVGVIAGHLAHGRNPDLALAEPLLDWILAGVFDQMVGQQKGHFDRDPFPRMMTTHEQKFAGVAFALPDAQRPNRAVFHAVADFLFVPRRSRHFVPRL
jgi:hypothetical protein